MSGRKVFHVGTSDRQVYGVCAPTASDARRYLADRLTAEEAEDPTLGSRAITSTVFVGPDTAGAWEYGTVIWYGAS